MKTIKAAAILLFTIICSSVFAQNFTYSSNKGFGLKKIAHIVLEQTTETDVTIYKVHQDIPQPAGDYSKAKAYRNANRHRKFTNKLSKYVEAPADISPVLGHNFHGLTLGTAGIPNDNNMAISNDGIVVSVVNSSVTVMDNKGNRLLYRSLRGIVKGQLSGLNRTYDPKITYDPENDRFILVFLQGSTSSDSRIIVGFSETNDPTKGWNFYAVTGNPFGGKTWSDYPIIGINKDDLFITVNILKDNESWQEGFTQSVIWQVDKASGYDGNDSVYQTVYHDIMYDNKPIWSICAVQSGETKAKDEMFFLSVRPGDLKNDTLFVHKITGAQQSGNSNYSLKVKTTDLPYGVPPSAFQPQVGFKLQTNDCRVLSAIMTNNTIQYVQTSFVEKTNSSGIFHGFYDLGTSKITASYISSDTFDYAYPSIAFSGNDKSPLSSLITFSHVSELDYAGTSVAFHNKITGQASIFSNNILIKKGEGIVDRFVADSIERWGDYTGIQRKYNEDGVVWLSGSYGDTNKRNNVWVAEIIVNNELHVDVAVTSVIAMPNPIITESSILVSNDKEQKLALILTSQKGSLIDILEERKFQKGEFVFTYNWGKLRSGVYFLSVVNEKNKHISATKIIVP